MRRGIQDASAFFATHLIRLAALCLVYYNRSQERVPVKFDASLMENLLLEIEARGGVEKSGEKGLLGKLKPAHLVWGSSIKADYPFLK